MGDVSPTTDVSLPMFEEATLVAPLASLRQGRFDEARDLALALVALGVRDNRVLAALAMGLAGSGKTDEARALIAELGAAWRTAAKDAAQAAQVEPCIAALQAVVDDRGSQAALRLAVERFIPRLSAVPSRVAHRKAAR